MNVVLKIGFLLFVASMATMATADTRYVSLHGAAESGFTSLKNAANDIASVLDVAQDGDLIVVAPGTYRVKKKILVNRAVNLISARGAGETILVGQGNSPAEWCFDVQSGKAIIDGFTISKFRGGVRFSHGEGTSAVVRNCVIRGNSGHGIFFNHGGCAKNCTVVFNEGAGLYAYDMGGGGDSPANLILFGNQQPFVRKSANIRLQNCMTEDPQFISKTDLRLTPDSPCIDRGRNEAWMSSSRDAAGAVRVRDGVVDIGAYEFPAIPKSAREVNDKTKWIELLPLVRANRDLKNAVWSWERRGALFSSGKVQARVSIPVKVEGSYEFQTRITVVKAKEAVSIVLPVTNSACVVLAVKGDNGNTESATSTLQLNGIKTSVEPKGNVTLKTGTEYLLAGRILKDGNQIKFECFCNDELVYRWSGKQSQIEDRVLIRPSTVQLETAYYTTARFSELRLRMLSGKATVLFPNQSANPRPKNKARTFDKLAYDSAKKAMEEYMAEVQEIDRVSTLRKKEAKFRLERSLGQLEKIKSEARKGKRYHGMLGSYFNHQSRIPFIMLSVPDGENIWNEHARKCFNDGKYDASKRLYKFEARGHVLIPKDGSYRLVVSRAAGIKLNGREYAVGAKVAGEPPYADVKLSKGIYEVHFDVGNNGGQLQSAMVRIEDRQSKRTLPIFVYESELNEFRRDLSLGAEMIETSKWSQQENVIVD